MILAAKSRPDKRVFRDIQKAGLTAVEVYLSCNMLNDIRGIVQLCKEFPFQYAVHAPNDGYAPEKVLELIDAIGAQILVFHNMYWDDEWEHISKVFKDTRTRICVENISYVQEHARVLRRYRFGSCLDLEHMQLECAGIYEEEFIPYVSTAMHVHLTGYSFGSQLWHTHIHHAPEHGEYMLNLLMKANYKGFVVSEARVSLQKYEEFKRLNDFFMLWALGRSKVKRME